jgi:hypothetical protein
MTLTFAAATSVTARGDGRFEVDLRPEYAVGRTKPNGGYLLACLGRAAVAAAAQAGSAHEHVIAAGAQYFDSPDVGPACIETQVLRSGKMATQVMAAIGNHGGTGVQAQFTLATLPAAGEPYWGGAEPVTLPPIGECHPSRHAGRGGITISFDPATRITVTPDGPVISGGGEFRAWFRDDDRDVVDPVGLLYAADALPPATAGVVLSRWVPTLDITVYIRAIPAPGPLRLRFRAQMIQDGFADEICEGWDSAGRLVLQSTQLAALRLPPEARPPEARPPEARPPEAGPPGLAR